MNFIRLTDKPGFVQKKLCYDKLEEKRHFGNLNNN